MNLFSKMKETKSKTKLTPKLKKAHEYPLYPGKHKHKIKARKKALSVVKAVIISRLLSFKIIKILSNIDTRIS